MDINVNVKIEVVENGKNTDEVIKIEAGENESNEELQKWVINSIEGLKTWVENHVEMNAPMAPAEVEAAEQLTEDLTAPKEEEPPEPKKETAPSVTLEDVRAKLGQLTKDGKQAQVKELISKFGGTKLSDVPEENYPELLKAAGEL